MRHVSAKRGEESTAGGEGHAVGGRGGGEGKSSGGEGSGEETVVRRGGLLRQLQVLGLPLSLLAVLVPAVGGAGVFL